MPASKHTSTKPTKAKATKAKATKPTKAKATKATALRYKFKECNCDTMTLHQCRKSRSCRVVKSKYGRWTCKCRKETVKPA